MSDLPAAQQHALQQWADKAIREGWLTTNANDRLKQATVAAPSQLFETSSRPLVVGLFGGTGVGKSTLLNRIAKQTIAKASAQRPTSRDVTVYVHQSVSVDTLPHNFPVHKMHTAEHSSERYRHVMFIDMPDFDSVETANQDVVKAWLPHLDIVLYVLSPERYRDDQGWQRLNSQVAEHAWIFVMNHWDRGSAEQLTDLRSLLAQAGLSDPLIFLTDCSDTSQVVKSDNQVAKSDNEDQFQRLEEAILAASEQSVIRSLEQHGVVARLRALRSGSEVWLQSLGSTEDFSSIEDNWHAHWQDHTLSLTGTLEHKIKKIALRYADPPNSWLSLFSKAATTPAIEPNSDDLLDDAFFKRLDNGVVDFITVQSQSYHLPAAALRQQIKPPYALARENVQTHINDALQNSLALPGSAWHRQCHKMLGIFKTLLPLSVLIWVAWRTLSAFIEGGSNPAAYLGTKFIVNAAFLTLLSWLIPTVLYRKFKPSPVSAAQRGLKKGLEQAYSALSSATSSGLLAAKSSSETLTKSYHSLWLNLPGEGTHQVPEALRRMLVSDKKSE